MLNLIAVLIFLFGGGLIAINAIFSFIAEMQVPEKITNKLLGKQSIAINLGISLMIFGIGIKIFFV